MFSPENKLSFSFHTTIEAYYIACILIEIFIEIIVDSYAVVRNNAEFFLYALLHFCSPKLEKKVLFFLDCYLLFTEPF